MCASVCMYGGQRTGCRSRTIGVVMLGSKCLYPLSISLVCQSVLELRILAPWPSESGIINVYATTFRFRIILDCSI